MHDCGDVLLFALSAQRQVRWATFKKCYDEVHRMHLSSFPGRGPEDARTSRTRALRVLTALGHIDLRPGLDGTQVMIAPPVLAALPRFGLRAVVLCGARSPSTLAMLRRAARSAGVEVEARSQGKLGPYAPTRVEVRSNEDARLQSIAERLGMRLVGFPPSRSIVLGSGSVREYYGGLAWSEEAELDWHCEDFDPETLRFIASGVRSGGLRLTRYQNPVTSMWRFRLWRDNQFAEVDVDWGRYAVLASESRSVLRFDPRNSVALVPWGAPLPQLLSRALALCSGYAPKPVDVRSANRSERQRCDAYSNVPPSVFRLIADRAEAKIDL